MSGGLASLMRALDSEGPRACYVLVGEDELARKKALGAVESAIATSSGNSFDRDVFELGSQPIDAILDAALTAGMFASRRLVVVRTPKGVDSEGGKALAAYIERPAPTTTLILVARKLDMRSAFAKAAKKSGALVVLDPPSARELPGWIAAEATADGIELRPDAARLLVDLVGKDPLMLKTTLDKVVTFVGELRPIVRADVEAAVAKTREEVVWDLVDALGNAQLDKALTTLHGMLEHGESPIGIVAMAARQYRQLWTVRSHLRSGTTPDQLSKAAGIHPFAARKLSGQARRFDDGTLARAMGLFFEADRRLKSSRLDSRLVVERLVVSLIGLGASATRR